MAENNGFVDPLENIIKQTQEAFGIPTEDDEPPTPVVNKITPPEEYMDDDIYGVNDFEKELAEEEQRLEEEERARKEAIFAERRANEKPVKEMPPRSLDPEFQAEAVGLQADHLAVVTGMIEKVKAKYHLTGGIPKEKQRFVQGDLLSLYYQNGDEITPEFEQVILNNWEHVDPQTGNAYPVADASTTNVQSTGNAAAPSAEPMTINIDVEAGTRDVVVNIPEEVAEIATTRTNVVNVHVREVTEEEMKAVTVIENPVTPGIIHPYESNLNDVPVTLPLSGYKCVIRPVNWFESIDLAAPSSNSKTDFQVQKMSVIYDHIKNVSIGAFENFEDFLKKTKYADIPILEWAVLTATADETEKLTIVCGNPNCAKRHEITYVPRTIIHLKEDRLPKKYWSVHNAAPGPSAIQLFNEINKKRTRYKLPETGIIVEINEPSAYEYVHEKLPLIIEKYAEKRPEDPNMDNFDEETLIGDPTLMNFAYKMACLLRISAINVPDPNNPNKEYRFTKWEEIEKQINNIKLMRDSMLIVKLAMDAHSMSAPAEFYLDEITCPYCGHVDRHIPISDISQTLLFRVSRRLENMEINLIPLD